MATSSFSKRKPARGRQQWNALLLTLASPERILEWSSGEVTKPETINYRTQRSEKHGLFDEKIFGPEKDYECYCGKYRGIRYKGIVCDKCGVEITRSVVRRERMGHIELVTPISHIWFLRNVPSRMALILGIPRADLEKVIYFAGYIITKVSEDTKKRLLKELDSEYKTKYQEAQTDVARDSLKEKMIKARGEIDGLVAGRVLDEIEYHRFSVKYSTLFEAHIGAEAIYNIFKEIDLKKLQSLLEERYTKAPAAEREKISKRLLLISGMITAKIRPEWMFLTRIPVIPPALRPMVALDGGRHATSDVNDLYRRVINRNNRLKKLKDVHAPEVILRNEHRILQEAVDSLIDNSIRKSGANAGAMTPSQRRPLKSLADYLKGKQGYFRQNLLGKRVDYSGRSVIVVEPDFELDECGLPKHMALELFRPFVIAGLFKRELAFNIRGAGRLIEDGAVEVWEILEEVIQGKYVLLNRAPTLHRQGIQAFRPRLIEGDAIRLHPLVCPAFNADFDGDQMAVHVPLSQEGQWEAKHIMSANENILKPGSGTPVIATSHDIALGTYWLTKETKGARGEGNYFTSPNAAVLAYDYGAIDIHAPIHVHPASDKGRYAQFEDKIFETTVGRILFNTVLPSDYPYVNTAVTEKVLGSIINDSIERYGLGRIPSIANNIKHFGFEYATRAGITWSFSDISVPKEKGSAIAAAREKISRVEEDYKNGLLGEDEKYRMDIEIWHDAKQEVEKLVAETLEPESSVYDIITSGSRGSMGNLTQMVGMKGLIQSTSGKIIDVPIISSMMEGLNPIEYFMSTHGSRKGLTDTALGTARAGYLTRRLFDVAQDSIITTIDCGTNSGVSISRTSISGVQVDFAGVLRGRTLSSNAVTKEGEVLLKKGTYLTKELAIEIASSDIDTVMVRSALFCDNHFGVCQVCYGMDLASLEPVEQGTAVGTIAAQAIGEPGTQLTMRTFHAGGAASVGGDITQGLPRVEEIFEKRTPKNPAIVSKTDGVVTSIEDKDGVRVIMVTPPAGQGKKDGSPMAYTITYPRQPIIEVGASVKKGQLLTDGSASLDELFLYAGREATQEYMIVEVSKIYELQGAKVSRKHIEVVMRQMFSRVRIVESGDSDFAVGDVIDEWRFAISVVEENEKNTLPPKAKAIILGIKESALSRQSFLSAASFEQTTKVLITAALKGNVDTLRGLKENVILGRIIPAGTGFAGSKKQIAISKMQEQQQKLQEEKEAQRERDAIAAQAALDEVSAA